MKRKLIEWLKQLFNTEPKIDTMKELKRARDVEDRIEQVCKILKCKPDEMLTKINKVQTHILELEAEKLKFEEAGKNGKPIESFKGQYAFLSNFYPVEIDYDGLKFHTLENAFQSTKSTNLEERKSFIDITPGQSKRLGRTITLRDDWAQVKLQVMRELLMIKFQKPELKALLLGTKGSLLIEGNDWGDTYWGVCNGVGENHLGLLLMEIRENLALDK